MPCVWMSLAVIVVQEPIRARTAASVPTVNTFPSRMAVAWVSDLTPCAAARAYLRDKPALINGWNS